MKIIEPVFFRCPVCGGTANSFTFLDGHKELSCLKAKCRAKTTYGYIYKED